jgi:ubiquinone/menaquinone biosynthesis C-methylase UbiE
MMKSVIKRLIPKPIKSAIKLTMRNARYQWQDTIGLLSGRRDRLTPPRRMIESIGDGDFKKIGEAFFSHFTNLCDLKPGEKVLDVGSGSGRMAVPLTKYLSSEGSYEGFDITPQQVKWCQKNITPKYPNFRFQLADIYNKMYNPQGKFKASDYKFPYANESFDFVFLTSVFTHLLPPDMEHYLSEIARVLRKNGRCFITFFLLNEESLQLIDAKKSSRDFKFDLGEYSIENEDVPEGAVGYDETFIKELYQKYNLEIKLPVYYGSWCERSQSFDYQDIVIASKKQ